jgi:nitric oxide reductase activation protein
MVENTLEQYADVVQQIKQLISNARVSRPQRLRKQHDGDYLDIDACIEAEVSKRLGEQPDPRVYSRTERRHRDLSVMVLLDISESTNEKILESEARVIDVECQATALLAHAMAGLNDPFAIAAFCSNQREEVHYYRVKNFDTPYEDRSQSYLAGLTGGYSTRLGAAIRHAAEDLKTQLTHRRLILVLSDGEPSDIDVSDKNYLVEDARHAIHSLAQHGIDVFCVGLESGGENYLTRVQFVLACISHQISSRGGEIWYRACLSRSKHAQA